MNMKTLDEYQTTDLYLAAFLAVHFPTYWIEDKENGKATFIFDKGKQGKFFDDLCHAYWSGAPEALIHPRKYAASLKDLKSRLYNE